MNRENSNTGELVVKARTGFGLYPLAEVLVRVISENGAESRVISEVYTDRTGSTPDIVINFEEAENTANLDPKVQRYTIEAEKDGYQKVILHGVEVLAGVKTVQVINMAALPDKAGLRQTQYDREMVMTSDV